MNRTSCLKRRYAYPFVSLCLFLLVLSFTTVAQQISPKLVDSGWLKENLSRTDMRIIDLRGDVKAYWEGHIPGAVYLNPEALKWPDRGVPVKLIQPEALALLLGQMGIDRGTLVVAYSEGSDFHATYFLWALDYVGHEHSVILDGGFESWEKNGGPSTQEYPDILPTRYPIPSELREAVRATVVEVQEASGQEDAVLLDVRPKDMYDGGKGFWKFKGHIPGAIHHFVGDDLTKDGVWKNKADLKAQYEKIGLTADKTIIVMCGSGKLSSRAYVSLRHVLGYPNVKNFDGSINEWSSLTALPEESGSTAGVDIDMLLERKCTRCHNLKRVHREQTDRAGWQKIIDRMIKKGTKLTDEERTMLIDGLSRRGK